jgi:hypothetical protein
MDVLDKNKNGEISTHEIEQAVDRLKHSTETKTKNSMKKSCAPPRTPPPLTRLGQATDDSLLFEQVGVGSCSLEDELISVDLVDQQPVGFDVAIAPPKIVSRQLVIPMNGIQRLAGQQ